MLQTSSPRPARRGALSARSLRLGGTLSVLSVLGSVHFGAPALAQQFQVQNGALPGPNRWSEGVTAVDVDLDGDKDLLFANGDGFANAGTKRQNLLIINRQIEQAPGVFADESVARLGVHVSNAKQAIAGDVNGDGYPDLLFLNAFNTDTPFLYINRGAAQPGFFDMESATRGLTEALSSAAAQFGDLDDDGDLDLVISDSGASFLGGAGAPPKLYMNDGTGVFTDASAQLNAPTMVAQMDVHLIDMDRDWDLDIVITNRGSSHYLLLNDGSATFSDASSLLPSTGNVYEAEVSDFDDDSDVDFFFLSRSGFNEGTVRNNLAQTGALTFSTGPTLPGGQDDNEIGLIDYDMDGDLDVLVGSLGPTERFYRNNGSVNFSLQNGVTQVVGDSTLDLALADLDGDGDYDYVTAQGESGNFLNRMYFNSGPADTLAPRTTALNAPTFAGVSETIVHAKIADQIMDDGEAFVTAECDFARVLTETVEVEITAAGFAQTSLTVARGTRIVFRNSSSSSTTLNALIPSRWTRTIGAGETQDRVFVAVGSHTIEMPFPSTSPPIAITVTGTRQTVATTYSGNGLYRAALPTLPQTDSTYETAAVFIATDDVGNEGWSDAVLLRDADAPGETYCRATVNSTGFPAGIVARGSDTLLDTDLTLEAYGVTPGQFGLFAASINEGATPLASGVLCLSAPFIRFPDILNANLDGTVTQPVDFGFLPFSTGFTVGSTWHFTYWFRDPASGGGANLSNGVRIEWK